MKTSRETNKFISLGLIFFGFSCLLYCNYINRTFWYDEAYTIALMKYSFSEIWKITSLDVHPPLYYFMLKTFISIFGETLFTMRIFSSLGVIATCFIGLFSIKRLFGEKVSFSFILLMILMPINQYLGVEIRMYSWAMFFVLISAVYAYDVFQKETLFCYSKMTFFAICAAYTHYYALIAVFSIYLILTIYIYKRQKTIIRPVLFCFIFLLAYSPWIPILAAQIYSVHQSFWIEAPTPKEILIFCYYFFSPKEPSHPSAIFSIGAMSAGLITMLGLLIYLTLKIISIQWKNKRNKKLRAGAYFILVFVSTIIITFVITFVIKPISVPRYTSCMLGALILGLSIYGVELYRKKPTLIFACLIMLTILSTARFFSEKKYYITQNKEFEDIKTYILPHKNEMEIIADFDSYPVLANISILLPEKEFLLYSPNENKINVPFYIKTIESLPSTKDFFLVKASYDTTQIFDHYKIKSKLKLDKITISQLEANNSK